MLFWISSHTKVEFLARMLYWSAIGKEAFVELCYLLYQVCGMCMSTRGRGKHPVVFGFIAS